MRSWDYEENTRRSWSGFLAGAGIGVACMYLIDPSRGARRREVIRETLTRAAHLTADGIDATGRDLTYFMEGLRSEAQHWFGTEDSIPDVLRTNWSPGARTLVGSIGSALLAYGASRRDVAGTLVGIAGAGLVLRAATNLELSHLVGASDSDRGR